MYTVVLMTAIAAGSSTPDWGFRHGCRGCQGCYGYASCYGSCYGCWGGSCQGCSGCYGCSGWYGCSGCYGATYGCHGARVVVGAGCGGCHGCYGGHSAYGMPHATHVIIEGQPKDPAPKDKGKPKNEEDNVQQVRAKVTIDLPEGARLFVDGQQMKSGSGRRHFQTPNLQPGQAYFYDVRVEITRNGQTLSDSQRIILRPGENATASFAHMDRPANDTATAQAGAR